MDLRRTFPVEMWVMERWSHHSHSHSAGDSAESSPPARTGGPGASLSSLLQSLPPRESTLKRISQGGLPPPTPGHALPHLGLSLVVAGVQSPTSKAHRCRVTSFEEPHGGTKGPFEQLQILTHSLSTYYVLFITDGLGGKMAGEIWFCRVSGPLGWRTCLCSKDRGRDR